jgi:hypothetical protein
MTCPCREDPRTPCPNDTPPGTLCGFCAAVCVVPAEQWLPGRWVGKSAPQPVPSGPGSRP